jgi:hypothetical protein
MQKLFNLTSIASSIVWHKMGDDERAKVVDPKLGTIYPVEMSIRNAGRLKAQAQMQETINILRGNHGSNCVLHIHTTPFVVRDGTYSFRYAVTTIPKTLRKKATGSSIALG